MSRNHADWLARTCLRRAWESRQHDDFRFDDPDIGHFINLDPIATKNKALDIAVRDGLTLVVGKNGNWICDVPYPEAGLQGGRGILHVIQY